MHVIEEKSFDGLIIGIRGARGVNGSEIVFVNHLVGLQVKTPHT